MKLLSERNVFMKLLVSDFDGTLFIDYPSLEKNIHAIQRFREEGNLFVINSGRNYTSLMKEIKQYQIPYDYLICIDGSKIFDSKGNEISSITIDSSISGELFQKLIASGVTNEVYFDDGYQLFPRPITKPNSIIARYYNSEMAERILQELVQNYPEIDGYLSAHWINITSSKSNKAVGIRLLCEMEHLSPTHIYTLGDGNNDLSMIREFEGYTVQNANAKLSPYSRGSFASLADFFEYIKQKGSN